MSNSLCELKISAAEISAFVGVRPRDIDQWLQRPELVEKFKASRHGARRSMSRENVLQLAFIAIFLKIGLKTAEAIELSTRLLDQQTEGQTKEWIVVAQDQEPISLDHCDELPSLHFIRLRANASTPPLTTVVAVGETIRRVDQLFSERSIRRKLVAVKNIMFE